LYNSLMKKIIPKWLEQDTSYFSYPFKKLQALEKSFAVSLLLLLFTSVPSIAQNQITVSGTVTDENGQSLPGTSIQLKDVSGLGTITDINGNYNFAIPDEYANGTLIYSYIGYLTEEI